MNQLLRVALAVIIDPAGSHILIARRLEDAHLGGYWEFPGGKIETNESAAECAMREALEEVGLDVVVLAPMTPVSFDYKDRRISLARIMHVALKLPTGCFLLGWKVGHPGSVG